MKKVIYLFALMFSLILMSTSCEKDDPVVPDSQEITVTDLLGMWEFQSLEIVDVRTYVFSNPIDSLNLDIDYSYGALDLDISSTKINFLDLFNPYWYEFSYILNDNIINMENKEFEFEIVNVDTFDGTILKLKLLSSNVTDTAPFNGIYTFQKH